MNSGALQPQLAMVMKPEWQFTRCMAAGRREPRIYRVPDVSSASLDQPTSNAPDFFGAIL
jgi:hypothetical protein